MSKSNLSTQLMTLVNRMLEGPGSETITDQFYLNRVT